MSIRQTISKIIETSCVHMSNPIIDGFMGGVETLASYLAEHVLTCLVPAFFIAGAIAVFLSKNSVLKYFGPDVKKWLSYSIASISGVILAVCSCTVLPLFTGIYKRGAGIGPATAFLYAGPAINVLAISYTATALGYNIGLARAVGAISLAFVVGFVMSTVFGKEEMGTERKGFVMLESSEIERPKWVVPIFFISLVGILVTATASQKLAPGLEDIWFITLKVAIVYFFTLLTAFLLIFYFSRDEVKEWGIESWDLTKKIFPILLVGTFIVGVIGVFIPPETFEDYLGGNSLSACFLASIVGAMLYMPTLLEVPIIGETFGYNYGIMGGGPALALLLAGPSVSLPSLIVINRVLGIRKTAVYAITVVMLSTFAGFIYGNYFA